MPEPRALRKMRRNLRKLLVRQPEMVPIYWPLRPEAVNHNPLLMPTILSVRTLTISAMSCDGTLDISEVWRQVACVGRRPKPQLERLHR